MSGWHCEQEVLHEMMHVWSLSNTLMQWGQRISHTEKRRNCLVEKLSAWR
jgi:hypothetical protein